MQSARTLRENAAALLQAEKDRQAADKANKKKITGGFKSFRQGIAGLYGKKPKKDPVQFTEVGDDLIDIKQLDNKSTEEQSNSRGCFPFFSCCHNPCQDEQEEERRALLHGK